VRKTGCGDCPAARGDNTATAATMTTRAAMRRVFT
jgi:hypothetical protein